MHTDIRFPRAETGCLMIWTGSGRFSSLGEAYILPGLNSQTAVISGLSTFQEYRSGLVS
jgi:hypothetical protein